MAKSLVPMVVVAAMLGGCWCGPGPIDAVSWEPPAPPAAAGPLAPNRELERAVLVAEGLLDMPEDVAVDVADPALPIYAGVADGRIMRIEAWPGEPPRVTTFATTGGIPLGLKFDGQRNLIACVAGRGLLSIDRAGGVRLLADRVGAPGGGGRRFSFINDVDVAKDGTIYFSESSPRHTPAGAQPVWAIAEARAEGTLFRYDPRSGEVRALLGGLAFANGVAVAADGRSVLVAETSRYRIRRYWLAGPKAGTDEVFADNLPGVPDGVMGDGKGLYWVALVPRDPLLAMIAPRPWLANMLGRLPEGVLVGIAAKETYGLVAALDEQGRVVRTLHDASGRFKGGIANVAAYGGVLYMGTKWGRHVAMMKLD